MAAAAIPTISCATAFTPLNPATPISRQILKRYGLDRSAIVSNVNWFMSVPVLEDGSAGIAAAALKPGSHVALRAERDVLAVLSNCPQMHNPCNGYNPTPIRVTITRPVS